MVIRRSADRLLREVSVAGSARAADRSQPRRQECHLGKICLHAAAAAAPCCPGAEIAGNTHPASGERLRIASQNLDVGAGDERGGHLVGLVDLPGGRYASLRSRVAASRARRFAAARPATLASSTSRASSRLAGISLTPVTATSSVAGTRRLAGISAPASGGTAPAASSRSRTHARASGCRLEICGWRRGAAAGDGLQALADIAAACSAASASACRRRGNADRPRHARRRPR